MLEYSYLLPGSIDLHPMACTKEFEPYFLVFTFTPDWNCIISRAIKTICGPFCTITQNVYNYKMLRLFYDSKPHTCHNSHTLWRESSVYVRPSQHHQLGR